MNVFLRKTFLPLLLLLLVVFAVQHFVSQCASFSEARLYDFPLFTQSAIRYWQGEHLYIRADDLLNQYKPGAIVFKFPPPYLFPFLPWFDASGVWPAHFQAGFIALGALLYMVTVLLACRCVWLACGQDVQHVFPAGVNGLATYMAYVLIAACWFVPILHVLGATSIENFLICVAVIAFMVMRRYPWLAGMLLAYLAMIKIYPLFLLAYPLLTQQWRVLLAASVSLVLIAIVSVGIYGWEENYFYVTNVLPILINEPVSEDWTDMFKHASGNLGIVKVLVTYGLLPNRNVEWLNVIRLPLVAIMAWILWSRVRTNMYANTVDEHAINWSSTLGYSLVIVTMMVCLPNLFFPYLTVLFFPLIIVCGYLLQHRQWRGLLLLLLPMSSLWINDAWTMAEVNLYQLLSPSPELVVHVQQLGLWRYLLQEQPWLAFLMIAGRIVPFTPYILWVALAGSLFFFRAKQFGQQNQ